MDTSNSFHSHPTIVLTGGAGFLGKAIVTELLDPDCPIQANEIRVFDSNDYTGPLDKRVHVIQGDIRNYDQVNSVCMGANIVIHSAAIIDWGTRPKSEVISVNYGGTQNVLKACIEKNISRLLYTSSLDAVYTGNSLVNIDESLGYPEKHQTSYCESKYLSEKLILSANNDSLKTCVIRPSDIYGEDDRLICGQIYQDEHYYAKNHPYFINEKWQKGKVKNGKKEKREKNYISHFL